MRLFVHYSPIDYFVKSAIIVGSASVGSIACLSTRNTPVTSVGNISVGSGLVITQLRLLLVEVEGPLLLRLSGMVLGLFMKLLWYGR